MYSAPSQGDMKSKSRYSCTSCGSGQRTRTPPGGSAIEVKAPPQSAYGVKDTLLEVASGPLLFTGETNAEGPVRK